MAETAAPMDWRYDKRIGSVLAANDAMMVCDIRGWGYLTGSGGLALPPENAVAIQHANGRLIAAAPVLLATLRDVSDFLRHSGYDTRLVNDAIAMATGAST